MSIIQKAHRNTTKKVKVSIPIFLFACLVISSGIWAQKIHGAAEDLRRNPAFRIVKSCETPKEEIFEDFVLTDFQLIPCK